MGGNSSKDDYLCELELIKLITNESGEVFTKEGEFFVQFAKTKGSWTEHRYPAKGSDPPILKMKKGDEHVPEKGKEIVYRDIVDLAAVKRQLKKEMKPGHTPCWNLYIAVKEEDPLSDDLMLEGHFVCPLDGSTKVPYVDNSSGNDVDVIRGYATVNNEEITLESKNHKIFLTVRPHVTPYDEAKKAGKIGSDGKIKVQASSSEYKDDQHEKREHKRKSSKSSEKKKEDK